MYLFIYYIIISVKESGCVKLCQLCVIQRRTDVCLFHLRHILPQNFCKILAYRYAFSLLSVSEILWKTPELCADEVIPPALSPRPSR